MVGLIDNLVLEQIDPGTGESLGCWKTLNTDQEAETPDAEECLYSLKAQSVNTEVITNFINMVEGGRLQLLEKRADADYDIHDSEYIENEIMPFVQTDQLLEEVANLKLETLSSGKLKVTQQTTTIDNDRYSALAYGLWYIKTYEEDGGLMDTENRTVDYLLIN